MNMTSEENELPIITLPPPPDGGYGWVVVFAVFSINFLANGSIMALGIFLESIVEDFGSTYQSISTANSILYGVYMCSMPINSAMINVFGCRKVCFSGGIIFGLGFCLSSISPNMYIFYLTYGVMMGWSSGMVILSAVLLVAFYFEKRRSLANAIAMCGTSIGAAVWSPFGSILLKSFGWRTTFGIFGGINFCICGLALLLTP